MSDTTSNVGSEITKLQMLALEGEIRRSHEVLDDFGVSRDESDGLRASVDERIKKMRQAHRKAFANLAQQLDQISSATTTIQAVLDRLGVPADMTLSARLSWFAETAGRWHVQQPDTLAEQIRQALNTAPPSDSDVREGTSAAELVRIVRVRNELMLEERARRVALAQEVEALKRQAEQEHVKLIARLDGWMSGDETNVRRELEDQVIRAVEAGGVTAHDAINALRHRRSLAELVLAVDFGDNDIPF